MRRVKFKLIKNGAMIIYPDIVENFSNVDILKNSVIADYRGGMDLEVFDVLNLEKSIIGLKLRFKDMLLNKPKKAQKVMIGKADISDSELICILKAYKRKELIATTGTNEEKNTEFEFEPKVLRGLTIDEFCELVKTKATFLHFLSETVRLLAETFRQILEDEIKKIDDESTNDEAIILFDEIDNFVLDPNLLDLGIEKIKNRLFEIVNKA